MKTRLRQPRHLVMPFTNKFIFLSSDIFYYYILDKKLNALEARLKNFEKVFLILFNFVTDLLLTLLL